MNTRRHTPSVEMSLVDRVTSVLHGRILTPARQFSAQKPLGAVGGVIVFIFVLLALGAPLVVPFDPNKPSIGPSYGEVSGKHPLGTDELGRDIFSRLLVGARISLFVGFFAPGLGITIGSIFGVLSGYVGGKFDLLGQRIVDVLMAIPGLLLVLVLLSMIGFTMWNMVLAVSFGFLVVSSRVMRAAALSIKEREFVEAARVVGATNLRILLRHIAPNCVAPYIVLFAIYFGQAVLLESTLSFLGVGVPPPTASWGNMLTSAQAYVRSAPQAAIAPGICLSVVVLGINLLGDSLRDVLDPRQRGTS